MSEFVGSSFEDFLEEEGLVADVEAGAIKKLIVYQLLDAIEKEKITKSALATKMNTSRAAVNRLLDPNNCSITLNSLLNAANVLKRKVVIQIL